MRIIINLVFLFVVVTFLAVPMLAQYNNLPEYGDIADIKDLQKVYLVADSTDARNLILKEMKKYPTLIVVNSPNEAEFFLEYKVLRQEESSSSLKIPITISEMIAYTSKNKNRRIAWSKTENDAGISRPNEVNLTRSFIKALKKIRDGKKS